jgi:predicted aconitase
MSPLPTRFRTLMTDSGKYARYLPSEHAVDLVYGSTEACVQAVVAQPGRTGA